MSLFPFRGADNASDTPRMTPRLTSKKVIMILVMIALVLLFGIYEDWLKSNTPSLYPYYSVVFGIAIGIGLLLNAVPGQTEDKDASTLNKVITFLGAVVFTFLFFGVADWIKMNYPDWFVTFRILVLSLLYLGWWVTAKTTGRKSEYKKWPSGRKTRRTSPRNAPRSP